MPIYHLHVAGSKEANIAIEAESDYAAIDSAVTAVVAFMSKRHPPPIAICIRLANDRHIPLATLKMNFKIEFAPKIRVVQ